MAGRGAGMQTRATVIKVGAVVLAAVLGATSGCHRSETDPGAAATAGPNAPKSTVDPAVQAATRKMAVGVPTGTGSAPVEVRFDLPRPPVPGQPFDVDIGVLPDAATPVLRVEVSGSEGLSVEAPNGPVSVEKVQAGALEHVLVRASSAEAGTRIVHVTVTLELPTGAETRDFAFPILIGVIPDAPPAAKPAAKASG